MIFYFLNPGDQVIEIVIDSQGVLRTLYSEELELTTLGSPVITRASFVEPTESGWIADLAPLSGPVLGPFPKRSQALAAEAAWIEAWLLAIGR